VYPLEKMARCVLALVRPEFTHCLSSQHHLRRDKRGKMMGRVVYREGVCLKRALSSGELMMNSVLSR